MKAAHQIRRMAFALLAPIAAIYAAANANAADFYKQPPLFSTAPNPTAPLSHVAN